MATVLVSFIGVGTPTETSTSSRGGYRTAVYNFPPENGIPGEEIESSIFGSVLLRRLRNMDRQVTRWLIFGTEQSIWDDLIDVFPPGEQDDLVEIWADVSNYVPKRGKYSPSTPMTQEILNKWQKALSEKLGIQVFCSLAGDCMTQESQEAVYQALNNVVQDGDNIVMDITHGLRHQPVLTSFMVMFLRWYRNVKKVEIYSGVLELGAQVVKLDMCNQILESTEALAIYQNTGNYAPMGKCLNVSDDYATNISVLSFADEINRADRRTPVKLKAEIESATLNPIQNSLRQPIEEALNWTTKENLAKRLGYKARKSFEHKQYLKAITLLWEALLVAGCRRYIIPNPDSIRSRHESEDKLYKRLKHGDRETLKKIEWLRNSVVHSSRTSDADVQKALNDEEAFRNLFESGWDLFKSLLGE